MGFGQEPIPGMDELPLKPVQRTHAVAKIWRLKIMNGPRVGSSVDLAQGVQVAGRNDPPSIVVDIDFTDAELGEPPMLSRRHVEFSVVEGRLQVTDLGSTNGTFVNDEKLAPRVAHPVEESGARLRLANLNFEVVYDDQ